jgi:hypothetical protein
MEMELKPESTAVNRVTTEAAPKRSTNYASLALMSLSSLLYYALVGDNENAGLAA